jgi:uncharacterized repeat protein (TIGR03803 family)
MKPESISATTKLLLAFAFLLAITTITIPQAQAQAFKVVYNFTGESDGGESLAGLTVDTAGNLYGTTNSGGLSNVGVVFKVTPSGAETVLHTFTDSPDGSNPNAGLLRDKLGNLYGTTKSGGSTGNGAVFEITASGKESVIYSFLGGSDAADPLASLAMDGAGNLYGTTGEGGSKGNGTVFKLTHPQSGAKWKETVLYSFGTGTDGAVPVAGVTLDAAGNIYGTTSEGGAFALGTIFKLSPSGSTWTETKLHDFEDGNDGAIPYAGLIFDKSGNLYGAATEGGTGGGGTIFKMTPASGGWTFTVLYSLPGWNISGPFRNLMIDGAGNLYGTTHCDGANDAGTVYKLSLKNGSWIYTSLYVFTGGTDGLYSFSNLVVDQGKLYGTTNLGGANGFGVVFEVKP